MRWTFEPGHTAAEFSARHMMVTHVRGHFKDVHGMLNFDPKNPVGSSVEVVIDANKIWTGEPALALVEVTVYTKAHDDVPVLKRLS